MGITAVVGTIFSIWIRYMFRDIISGDYRAFLEGWYDEIYAGGGIKSLDTQVGNYNFLYQFCIAVMTYIPIKSLYAYKILSAIFDLSLAVTTARMAGLLCEEHRESSMMTAYFMVLFSPITILNSSAWAQCDSIYVFWAVAALYGLLKDMLSRSCAWECRLRLNYRQYSFCHFFCLCILLEKSFQSFSFSWFRERCWQPNCRFCVMTEVFLKSLKFIWGRQIRIQVFR